MQIYYSHNAKKNIHLPNCAQRAQTSAKASDLNRKWSGIRNQISGVGYGCLFDRSQTVVDLLAYFVSVSHFAECCQNRPVTVWEMLINVNPKILSFAHRLISFAVILHTDRHSERQTERMTDKSTWSHKLRLDGDDKVYRYYLRQGGYVIGDVCLSVCLSVSKITEKVMRRFHWNLVLWFCISIERIY